MDVAAQVIGAVRLGLVDISDVIEELDTEEMQMIPEIHMLVYNTLRHNCRPSSSSVFSSEKAKPRSMNPVGKRFFLFLLFSLHKNLVR